MRLFTLLVALSIAGCTPKHAAVTKTSGQTSPPYQSMILGIWWSPDMPQAAAFLVTDSTFYYPDYFEERTYELQGDSLFFSLGEGSSLRTSIVKLTADTLILSTDGRNHLYTRTEPQP